MDDFLVAPELAESFDKPNLSLYPLPPNPPIQSVYLDRLFERLSLKDTDKKRFRYWQKRLNDTQVISQKSPGQSFQSDKPAIYAYPEWFNATMGGMATDVKKELSGICNDKVIQPAYIDQFVDTFDRPYLRTFKTELDKKTKKPKKFLFTTTSTFTEKDSKGNDVENTFHDVNEITIPPECAEAYEQFKSTIPDKELVFDDSTRKPGILLYRTAIGSHNKESETFVAYYLYETHPLWGKHLYIDIWCKRERTDKRGLFATHALVQTMVMARAQGYPRCVLSVITIDAAEATRKRYDQIGFVKIMETRDYEKGKSKKKVVFNNMAINLSDAFLEWRIARL